MGRPTKLDAEMRQKVLGLTRTGMPWARVAEVVGVSESTLHAWRKRGAYELHRQAEGLKATKAEQIYADFVEKLDMAEAEGEALLLSKAQHAAVIGGKTVKTVQKSEFDEEGMLVITEQVTTEIVHPPDARMALALLERRWPERWRRRDAMDPSLSPEDLAARVAHVLVEILDDDELGLSRTKRAKARTRAAELLREFGSEIGS